MGLLESEPKRPLKNWKNKLKIMVERKLRKGLKMNLKRFKI